MSPQREISIALPDASFARDALLAWFRGEFAAANAIIDALCGHLVEITGGGKVEEYAAVFTAIHRRRMNWIDVLQMQKYCSIADVIVELNKVAQVRRRRRRGESKGIEIRELDKKKDCAMPEENAAAAEYEDEEEEEHSPDGGKRGYLILNAGSQGPHTTTVEICSNHKDCDSRPAQIKLTKSFIAREPVKGHMVNVVKGLKLYEDVFTDGELSKLSDFVHHLQIAGRNGELPGETFKIFNQQMKGNKRELIQFGEPIFEQLKEDTLNRDSRKSTEQIPSLLQNVMEHLVQWHLIPNKMPNSCIINFFDQGEYSQPYLKPPHVEEPITTLVLADVAMAFGRTLVSDNKGNYQAGQILSLKKGSLLVMRGNSANTAAHAACASPTKRVTITFSRVRVQTTQNNSMMVSPRPDGAMTVWQPRRESPHPIAHEYNPLDTVLNFGVLYAPVPILPHPIALDPRHMPGGGTGVFLPWTGIPRKNTRYLPPRAQNGRLLALHSTNANHKTEFTTNTSPDTAVC